MKPKVIEMYEKKKKTYRHSLPIEAITVQCTNAKPESQEIENLELQ